MFFFSSRLCRRRYIPINDWKKVPRRHFLAIRLYDYVYMHAYKFPISQIYMRAYRHKTYKRIDFWSFSNVYMCIRSNKSCFTLILTLIDTQPKTKRNRTFAHFRTEYKRTQNIYTSIRIYVEEACSILERVPGLVRGFFCVVLELYQILVCPS